MQMQRLLVRSMGLFSKKKPPPPKEKECPPRDCGKRPGGLFKFFKSRKYETKDLSEKTTDKEELVCRKQYHEDLRKRDPDLSHLGGEVYRTCGSAFVVQKPNFPLAPKLNGEEDAALRKIEAPPDLKNYEDPIPEFRSAELRLLELNDKRLHPFYKKYLNVAKEVKICFPKTLYKNKSGPVRLEEIPSQLKLSKELLESKNIFADFKRAVPPNQILTKLIEMDQNRKPTLEPPKDKKKPQREC